jgi:RHS repeat-associated protein
MMTEASSGDRFAWRAVHRSLHHPGAHRRRRRTPGQARVGRYYRARYYHPDLQRFISEDPLSFAAGTANYYAYVENSPTNARDPSGLLFSDAVVWAINAAFKTGRTAEEIAVSGKLADAVLGPLAQFLPITEEAKNTVLPGMTSITLGDVLETASVVSGVQTLFLGETIATAYGAGAAVGAATAGGVFFAGGLAFLGGYEIGGAINDLVLNNRRLFRGGNPLENLIFEHFVLPRIKAASASMKGSFGKGR